MKSEILYRPSQALTPYIEYYSFRNIVAGQELVFPSYKERVFNITLRGNFRIVDQEKNSNYNIVEGHSILASNQTRYNFNIALSGTLEMLVVKFTSAGFYQLTGISLKDCIDRFVPGDELFGTRVSTLAEQICDGKDISTRLDRVNLFFEDLLRKREAIGYRNRNLALPFDNIKPSLTVNQLADESCMSVRNFERQFLLQVGVSPKAFLRKQRFVALYNDLQNKVNVDWLDLCLKHGFYDQPHLSREFKHFTSTTPMQYLRSTEGFREVTV